MKQISCAFACLVAILSLGASAAPVRSQSECIADWAAAQEIITKHKLAEVDQLSISAAQQGLGYVVKARLCRGEAGYEYRVILLDPSGQLRHRKTAAKQPFGVATAAKK